MKILYIYLDNVTSLGVVKKVKSKIKMLSQLGLNIEGIFLNTKITKRETVDNITFIPLTVPPVPAIVNRRYIRNYKTRLEYEIHLKYLYKTLTSEVEKKEFDIILFRYPLANKYLLRFSKKYKNKIVFEHNSKELVELQLNPDRVFQYLKEVKYGNKVRANALALTGVGFEATLHQVERSGRRDMPNTVITNSIEVANYQPRIAPVLDRKTYNFLFLTGSPSPWVGIDLVFNALAKFKNNDIKINLYVVGRKNPALLDLSKQLKLESIVHFEGEKTGKDLDYYFNHCHVAIGTMAMHRVGLSEHSSLKVLEYASRGIPFILGYSDTNFVDNKAFEKFILQIKSVDTFDFNDVINFTNEVFQISDHSTIMNKQASIFLDTSKKMEQLKNFLYTLPKN